jgi:tetratricopeptide (TPR) repeat protein
MSAAARIDELRKRYDENPRRFFAPLANEYRKSGDLDQAISLCQEHLAEQPGNMNGHVVYGQALYEASRYEEARATFTTALQLDPENLIALRHLGDIARAHGDVPAAREWYTRVLDADPRNEEIQGFLAELVILPEPEPTPVPVAKTVEISSMRASTPLSPTPVIPMEAVEPPTEAPAPRPSMGLMDLAIDFGPQGSLAAIDPDAIDPPATDSALPDEPAVAAFPAFDDAPVESTTFAPLDLVPDAETTFGTIEEPVAESFAVADDPAAAPLPMVDDTADMLFGDTVAEPATTTPFVTETMAELYLQQGFRQEALDVYKQLLAQNPNDATLADRVRSLESGARTSLSFDVVDEGVEVEAAEGTVPLGAMFDAPMADVVPEPVVDAIAEPTAEMMPEPVADEFPEFVVDAAPDTVTEPAVVAEAIVEPEPIVEPAPAVEAEPPAEPVVTARAFFATLAQRRALRNDGTPPVAQPVVPPAPVTVTPAGGHAIAVVAGGTLDHLFGKEPSAEDEHVALAIASLADAFEVAAPLIKGKPTQAAATELSLDSVFRDSTPRASGTRNTPSVPRQSQMLRFDQFFAPADDAASAAPADDTAAQGDPGSPADLAQFSDWLTGLKKP